MLIFRCNKLFWNRIRYSGFEIKIPGYSGTSKCSIMHNPNYSFMLPLHKKSNGQL